MDFYKRAYEDTSQNPLWQYMLEYFYNRYANEAMRLLGANTLDEQLKYSIRLYCYGTVGMTREWLLTDNITPPDVIVTMMFQSMPENLRQIYFKVFIAVPEFFPAHLFFHFTHSLILC